MRRAVVVAALLSLLAAAPAAAAVPPHGDEIPPGADTMLADAAGPVVTALADGTWCGEETAADDVTHQAAQGNAIKVVYAHPADVADGFGQYAGVIQSDVKAVADAFVAAADDLKTVRVDLGTSCGPSYVDIQSVALPRTRADYLALDFNSRVDALSSDLRPLVAGGPSCPTVTSTGACTRDFLVYADGLYAGDFTTGVATRRNDTSAGPGNFSNRGGQFAYVLGDGSPHFGLSSATTAEHELLHNLGAVQDIAPHSTLAGHCFDEVDVMCYPDGGPLGQYASMVQSCPLAPESTIDCGNDDYFNPRGPILSGQTPMWNVYDSAFLCPVADCGSGAPEAAPAPAQAPAAPAAPAPVATPAPVSALRPPPARPRTARAARASLATLAAAWQPRIRRLLAGRPLRVTYRPPHGGTFVVRLMLGRRAVAVARRHARAGQRVVVTLRLSRASRRRLAHSRSRLKLALAFRR